MFCSHINISSIPCEMKLLKLLYNGKVLVSLLQLFYRHHIAGEDWRFSKIQNWNTFQNAWEFGTIKKQAREVPVEIERCWTCLFTYE